MRRLILLLLILGFAAAFEVCTVSVKVRADIGSATEDSLVDSVDFDAIQDSVDELLGDDTLSVRDLFLRLMSGEEVFSGEWLGEVLETFLTSFWRTQKDIWKEILVLVLGAAFCFQITSLFPDHQMSDISFYVIYLLVFALLVKNFGILSRELEETLEGILGFMRILTPAYFMTVAAATGSSTATMFYQIVLVIIWLVEHILIRMVIPGIHVFVLLSFVNQLSREDLLSKMAELLQNILQWAMQAMTALIVGLQVTRNLISPALDSLKRSAVGKTAEAIPGIGGAINAVTELVIGSAVLVRNCLGVTTVIILFLCAMQPVFHIAVSGLTYRFLAAVTQPVSDKRMTGALQAMGEGCALLLKVLVTTEILFLLTIAILANSMGGG